MKLTRLNQLLQDDQVVKGTWELTPNHKLFYRAKGEDEEIKLEGDLIAVEAGVKFVWKRNN